MLYRSRTLRRDVRYYSTPSSAQSDQVHIHSHPRQSFVDPERSRPLLWNRSVGRTSQALMLTSHLPDLCLVIRCHTLAARARKLGVSAFGLARVEHVPEIYALYYLCPVSDKITSSDFGHLQTASSIPIQHGCMAGEYSPIRDRSQNLIRSTEHVWQPPRGEPH